MGNLHDEIKKRNVENKTLVSEIVYSDYNKIIEKLKITQEKYRTVSLCIENGFNILGHFVSSIFENRKFLKYNKIIMSKIHR